jgi:hypothetical protein
MQANPTMTEIEYKRKRLVSTIQKPGPAHM